MMPDESEVSNEIEPTAEPDAATAEPVRGAAEPDAAAAEPVPGAAAPEAAAAEPTERPRPHVRTTPMKPAPGPATPSEARPNRRKVREGVVVSVSMDKTAVVGVVDRVRHPRYAKTVQRTKKLYAADDTNDLRVGDRVRLAETRPLSKLKRWRVVEILERAK
jgi:small subunit ribosomal protein S17